MEQPPIPAVAALLDFTGKVVLITGAGGGIGHGIATRFPLSMREHATCVACWPLARVSEPLYM